MPFTARQLDEVLVHADGPLGRLYDVELPYRRLGRCRMSDAVAAAIGTQRAQVALALSTYEARNGRHVTASELLGPGVDLGLGDAPEDPAARGVSMLGGHTATPSYTAGEKET